MVVTDNGCGGGRQWWCCPLLSYSPSSYVSVYFDLVLVLLMWLIKVWLKNMRVSSHCFFLNFLLSSSILFCISLKSFFFTFPHCFLQFSLFPTPLLFWFWVSIYRLKKQVCNSVEILQISSFSVNHGNGRGLDICLILIINGKDQKLLKLCRMVESRGRRWKARNWSLSENLLFNCIIINFF